MKRLFNSKTYIIVGITFIVLLAIGTLFDYQISSKLYIGSNLFSDIFVAIGVMPSAFAASVGAIMVVLSDNKRYKSVTFVKWFIAIGSFTYGFYSMYSDITDELNSIVPYIICAVILIGLLVLVYLVLRNYKNKTVLVLFGLALISTVAGGSVVTLLFKKIFARPRMRLLESESSIEFHRWFQSAKDIREAYIAKGIAKSEFKSFPSGHALGSSCMSLIWVTCCFNKKYEGKEVLFFLIGLGFALVTSFSRLICGAHFLSDVVVSIMINLFTQFVCYRVYLKNLKY